ncbi:MAG TPA: response regulator [Fredinandcohnia sp.]|nr:response regulator [Fredinandcohnia sp.]
MAHRHAILLIEDEPELALLLEEVLERYEVHSAGSMRRALELLETFRPCVVISDLSLPDVARDQVVASIRTAAPGVPIVLMSAIATQDLEETAREQGADRIVSKPFEIEDFEASLVFLCPPEQEREAPPESAGQDV